MKQKEILEVPYSITEQLLENEEFNYNEFVFDPFSNNDSIVKVLFNNKSIKYYMRYYNENDKDFLNENICFDYIISKPLFSLWKESIQKAKKIVTKKFAFLGQLEFLTEKSLYFDLYCSLTKVYIFVEKFNLSFFDKEKELNKLNDRLIDEYKFGYNDYDIEIKQIKNQIKEIKKLIHYPKLREDGKYPSGNDCYCWFIFEKQDINKNYAKTIMNVNKQEYPIIRWINNAKYILKNENK